MAMLDAKTLEILAKEYGDAFYLLHSNQFKQNFIELKDAFASIYPNVNIAYSYKTNYTPKLCKIVDDLGGYAEVVSDMELDIALHVGVKPENIIWNGPFKNPERVKELLLAGGTVNLDSIVELPLIERIAEENEDSAINIGIRVNFEINDDVVSRFGFDTTSEEFRNVLDAIQGHANINLREIQCHFATRRLETWPSRAKGMLALLDEIGIIPERIDLGGGLYGKIDDRLKSQFSAYIPTYGEYANAVAPLFAERFGGMQNPPELVIEPGSALVGDCMSFYARVESIKTVRNKVFITVLGSTHNINMGKNNPPTTLFRLSENATEVNDTDIVGYTCIEGDVIYRGYTGKVGIGDFFEFGNCGSYSVVLKPPFILPNFPILDISNGKTKVIKHGEVFDDLFHTYNFNA